MRSYFISRIPLGAKTTAVIEKIKRQISYIYGVYIMVEEK